MDILTQMCNWWWLAWLLPFILGLALGWAIWAKYKKMKEDLEKELAETKEKLKETEEDLARCKSHNIDLDSQIALLKGRLREAQYELEALKEDKTEKPKDKIAPIAAGTTPSVSEMKPKEEEKGSDEEE